MIRKNTILFLVMLTVSMSAVGQRYIDKTGSASFFSEAPAEDIEAHNKQALSIIDFSNGDIAVSILMKSFKFEKALMQEHFNEKYVHSDKFPKATFKGKIADISKVDLTKDGTYTVDVTGDLTMHGHTNPVATKANLVVKNSALTGNCDFKVKLSDYDIQILKVVVNNIAEVVDVKVAFDFQPQ